MARYPGFSENEQCQEILKRIEKSAENVEKGEAPITVPIWLSLKAFEKEYKLSQKRIIFKRLPEREPITPFEPYNLKTKAPKWWQIYNGLKHDVGVNIQDANLHNALYALAGAFLLNVYHIPAAVRLCKYGILKAQIRQIKDFGRGSIIDIACEVVEDMLIKNRKFWGFVETPLFIFSYEQKEE